VETLFGASVAIGLGGLIFVVARGVFRDWRGRPQQPLPSRGPGAVYRSRENQLVFIFLGFLTVPTVLYIPRDQGRGSPTDSLVAMTGALLLVALLVKGYRVAVLVREDGVIVRNFFRTFTLRWDEIERFEMGRRKWVGAPIGIACLKGGRRVQISAIEAVNPTFRPNHRLHEQLLAALNEELRTGS
jgi:hypothetical protein